MQINVAGGGENATPQHGRASQRLAQPSSASFFQPPPLSSSRPVSSTTMLSTPAALDSAALHRVRCQFGMNVIDTTTTSLRTILRYVVLSPTMVLPISSLAFHIYYYDVGMILVACMTLMLHLAVVTHAAQMHLGWVTEVQRCFPHSCAVAYREGTWVLIGSTQLLPGDLLLLVQGCVVHADCTLYRGSLLLDVSHITGETALLPAEPGHLIKAGTVIADGCGSAAVRFTNFDTFTGQTIKLLKHLAHWLEWPVVQRTYLCLCFTVLVVLVTAEVALYGAAMGRYHWSSLRVVREVFYYAWVCLPLNLDLAVLKAVSCGATAAMTRAQAVVLRLGSLLALASADVVVVDKTGTLTTGVYGVAGPFRSFSLHYPSRESLVQLMALATKWRKPSLHSVHLAVLRAANLDACDPLTRLVYVEHEGEHRTSTVLRQADGSLLRVTEGQVSSILSLLDTNNNSSNTFSNSSCAEAISERAAAEQNMEQGCEYAEAQRLETMWGHRGLRTRAVAVRHEAGPWQLAGLLTFEDTLRDDAAAFVIACKEKRVAVTVASGDARAAVAAVAAVLFPSTTTSTSLSSTSNSSPAPSSVRMMTGPDLPMLNLWSAHNTSASTATSSSTSAQLFMAYPFAADVSAVDRKAYVDCHVYAEMQPEHKVALVRLLQESGLHVGVLGDGLNDAAAACVADVGMAVVTPENGPVFSLQGALWGADIALPSSRLTAASDLIATSRDVFAAVYYLFFYVFSAVLQTALLLLVAVTFGSIEWRGDLRRRDCSAARVPCAFFQPYLIFLSLIRLIFQARHGGDNSYWAAAPCHHSCRVAAIQSACMAIIGAGAGVPFALGLRPCFFYHRFGYCGRGVALHAMVVNVYLFYLQLYFSLICASPARCGLRFVKKRLAYLTGFVVGTGLVFYLVWDVHLTLQLFLLLYCALVSTAQDAAKLTVHEACYRFNVFGYRSCVDHMTGRRRGRRRERGEQQQQPQWDTQHEFAGRDDHFNGRQLQRQQQERDDTREEAEGEEEGGYAVADAPLLREVSDVARCTPHLFSTAFNCVLGCIALLDVPLLRVTPPRRFLEDTHETP